MPAGMGWPQQQGQPQLQPLAPAAEQLDPMEGGDGGQPQGQGQGGLDPVLMLSSLYGMQHQFQQRGVAGEQQQPKAQQIQVGTEIFQDLMKKRPLKPNM